MKRSNSSSQNGYRANVVDPETLVEMKTHDLANVPDRDSTVARSPHQTTPVLPPETQPAIPDPSGETAPQDSPKAPRKRPVKAILAVASIGAIAAGAVGYQWFQYASAHEETDNATVTGHIHQISARIPGAVESVLVNDNQQVKKGQLLVKLDPRDYQIKLQQAQADLASAQQKANTAEINIALSAKNAEATSVESQGDIGKAQAAIAQAQAQVSGAQAGIPKAQAQLTQSQANLQKAQTDFNRFNSLYQDGAIAQRDLDAARQAYKVAQGQVAADAEAVRQAQAQLAQSQKAVETAQAGLTSSQATIQQAEAKGIQTQVSRSDFGTAKTAIAQAQAALKNAQLQLSYTNIIAPDAGKIGRKTVEVGQQIQAGTPLMALVSNQYWVTANFKETQLGKMHPGQKAEVSIDSFPGKKFEGHVDSLSPASGAEFALLPPDNATGNFTKVVQRLPVKVVLDPQSIKGYESLIAPGMSATVTVEVK